VRCSFQSLSSKKKRRENSVDARLAVKAHFAQPKENKVSDDHEDCWYQDDFADNVEPFTWKGCSNVCA